MPATNESKIIFVPSADRTCYPATAVVGRRFAKITADKQTSAAGEAAVDLITVDDAHTAGGLVFGVFSRDSAAGENVLVFRGGEVEVTAGAALTAGDPVMTDATGQAIPWVAVATNHRAGICTKTTANGATAHIALI